MRKSDLHLHFTTARRYRIIVPLVVFCAVLCVSLVVVQKIGAVYTATAKIWVVGDDNEGTGHEPGELPRSPLSSSMTTLVDLVASGEVQQLAYEELKKRLPQEQLPPQGALASVKASLSPTGANIITISYDADSPTEATKVVECFVAALQQESALQLSKPLTETRLRLDTQLAAANNEYARAKKALEDFEKENSTIDFNDLAANLSQERTTAEDKYREAQDAMGGLKTKIEYLQKQLGFGPDEVMSVEKISNDEVVKNLRQTIADTEVKLIELKSRFQDEHPRVKRLRAVLADARKEMADRYSTLIGKVDPKFEGVSADDESQHDLLHQMIEAKTEMVLGQARLVSYQSTLDELNGKIDAIPAKQTQFSGLQRQDELATNTVAAIEAELERIKLTESVSAATSALQVIDSGQDVENKRPAYSALGLIAAFFFALLTAVVQYVIDPRMLSAGYLRGNRVIGSIPKLADGAIEQALQPADRLRLAVKSWLQSSNVLWITSATRGDGKSLLARALAESFADAGMHVVLIDANLRHPKLHVQFGEKASPGLFQYVESDEPIKSIMREIRPFFHFIPSGGIAPDLRPIVGANFKMLLNELSGIADVIIVDSPAVGEDEFGLTLPDGNPNVLLIARMGNTIKSSLQTVLSQLKTVQIGEVGVVLNGVHAKQLNKLRTDSSAAAGLVRQEAPAMATADSGASSAASAQW